MRRQLLAFGAAICSSAGVSRSAVMIDSGACQLALESLQVLESMIVTAAQSLIVGCDVAGCRTADGARLARLGSVLVGPHGVCGAQGVMMVGP